MDECNMRVGVYAAVVRGDRVLLVQRRGTSGEYFMLPGGGVEAGETLEQALRRELRDECAVDALAIGPVVHVWQHVPNDARASRLGLIYHCHIADGVAPALPARPEPGQIGVTWVTLAELPHQRLRPALIPSMQRAITEGPRGVGVDLV